MRRSTFFTLVLLFATSTAAEAQFPFIRGDSNLSGRLDLSDGVNILNILFIGRPDPGCEDARDSNDDAALDITDGVFVLNFLFLGGPPPPAPYPECGCDETKDDLTCEVPPESCVDLDPCEGEIACFDQEALDQAIADGIAPMTCVPVDAAELEAGGIAITICPSAANPTCDGGPGCPVVFTKIRGTLDVERRVVDVFISGAVTDMPITVGASECDVDIDFSGEGEIPFVAEDDGNGNLVLVEVQSPVFDRDSVEIDLSASGGFICLLVGGFADQVRDDLIDQLETAAAELVVDLSLKLTGQVLCPVP